MEFDLPLVRMLAVVLLYRRFILREGKLFLEHTVDDRLDGEDRIEQIAIMLLPVLERDRRRLRVDETALL